MIIVITIITIIMMMITVQVYSGNSKGHSDTLVIAESVSLREDTTKVYDHNYHNGKILIYHAIMPFMMN